jgi:hypothetical protein
VDITPSLVATLSSFDSVSAAKFSGAQVAEYCKAFAKSSSCVILASDDIGNSLVAYDQMFRRLFDSSSPKRITFLIAGESSTTKEAVTTQIVHYLAENEIILSGQVSGRL